MPAAATQLTTQSIQTPIDITDERLSTGVNGMADKYEFIWKICLHKPKGIRTIPTCCFDARSRLSPPPP
jgi:hypothetical protein